MSAITSSNSSHGSEYLSATGGMLTSTSHEHMTSTIDTGIVKEREVKQAPPPPQVSSHEHKMLDDDVMWLHTMDDDDDDHGIRRNNKIIPSQQRPPALFIPSFITNLKETQDTVGSWHIEGTDSGM